MRCLVHGGAGAAPDKPSERLSVVERAAATGADEADPESAVVAAVRELETDPRFNYSSRRSPLPQGATQRAK